MIYQTHRINLPQLQQELITAGLPISIGLTTWGLFIAQVNDVGDPIEIDAKWQYVEDAHVAMRPKTTEEYQPEFATATPERKAEINSIQTGMLPPEMVVDTTPWPDAIRLKVQTG